MSAAPDRTIDAAASHQIRAAADGNARGSIRVRGRWPARLAFKMLDRASKHPLPTANGSLISRICGQRRLARPVGGAAGRMTRSFGSSWSACRALCGRRRRSLPTPCVLLVDERSDGGLVTDVVAMAIWRGANPAASFRRAAANIPVAGPAIAARSRRRLFEEPVRQRLRQCGDSELLLILKDRVDSPQGLPRDEVIVGRSEGGLTIAKLLAFAAYGNRARPACDYDLPIITRHSRH